MPVLAMNCPPKQVKFLPAVLSSSRGQIFGKVNEATHIIESILWCFQQRSLIHMKSQGLISLFKQSYLTAKMCIHQSKAAERTKFYLKLILVFVETPELL